MSKFMLISVDWEIRIAFLKNNTLEDYYHEQKGAEQGITGNIYTGIVEQVHPSINAAFVNIGIDRNAFLALDAVDYAVHPPKVSSGEKITIDNVLKEKDEVLVQVTKDATDTKGASLSTFVSLPGRYLVLSSILDSDGVSKKIVDDKEKTRFAEFLEKKTGDDHSIIVRTAGVGTPMKDIEREYRWLKKQWLEVMQKNKTEKKPMLIVPEQPLIIRAMRDYYHSDIDKILVNETNAFEQVKDFLNHNYPDNISTLHFYSDAVPLFYNFNIEAETQLLAERKIILPCGGYIVIDQTEALVAIDVNSGSARSMDAVTKILFEINLEAAEEVARQIRLRNLSGLIVIDFIDMQNPAYRKKVEEVLSEAMKKDRSKHTIMPISELGLLEISRQRIGQTLVTSSMEICSTCKGRGSTFSLITQTNKILRQIQNKAQTGNFIGFSVYGSPDLIAFLQKDSLHLLKDLEKQFDIKITLEADKHFFLADEAEIHTEERRDKKKFLVSPVSSQSLDNSLGEAAVISKTADSNSRSHSTTNRNTNRGFASHFLFKDLDTSNKEETFKDFQEKNKSVEEKKDSIHSKYLWDNSSAQTKEESQKKKSAKHSLLKPYNKKDFPIKESNKRFSQNQSTIRNRNTQEEQHSRDLSFRNIVKTEEAKNKNLWNKFKGIFSSKEDQSSKVDTHRKYQRTTTSNRRDYSSTSSRRDSTSRDRTFSESPRGRGRSYNEANRGGGTFSESPRGKGRSYNEVSRGGTFSESARGKGRSYNEVSRGGTFSESARGRGRSYNEVSRGGTFSESTRGRGRSYNEASRGGTFSESARGRGRSYNEVSRGRTSYENKEKNFNK